MDRKQVGTELVNLCVEAAHEQKSKPHTRKALAALGRAVAAQGNHVAPSWLGDFNALMREGSFKHHTPKKKKR